MDQSKKSSVGSKPPPVELRARPCWIPGQVQRQLIQGFLLPSELGALHPPCAPGLMGLGGTRVPRYLGRPVWAGPKRGARVCTELKAPGVPAGRARSRVLGSPRFRRRQPSEGLTATALAVPPVPGTTSRSAPPPGGRTPAATAPPLLRASPRQEGPSDSPGDRPAGSRCRGEGSHRRFKTQRSGTPTPRRRARFRRSGPRHPRRLQRRGPFRSRPGHCPAGDTGAPRRPQAGPTSPGTCRTLRRRT